MTPRREVGRGSRPSIGLVALLSASAIWLLWSRPDSSTDGGSAERSTGSPTSPAEVSPPGAEAAPLPPSTGWEEAAETIVTDLQGILEGHPRSGAFIEASVMAARDDLALYPPEGERLRRLLLGSDRERTLALAALSVHPSPDDDLVRLALRSRREGDDEVMRLLAAELLASLPPAQLSRHEEELLEAFRDEQNPLVLALALPALEQLEEGRLRALLRAQVENAEAPMLPVLVGLARDRLGREALADVGILVVVAPGE